MRRRACMVGVVVLVALAAVSVSGFWPAGIGLLGELIEWPSAFGGSPEIELYAAPVEDLVNTPQGDGIRFGSVELGNGADTTFSLAVRWEPEPRLWIDANNNEDLGDDGGGLAPDSCQRATYHWYVRVDVSYWVEPLDSAVSEWTEEYILRVVAHRLEKELEFSCTGYCLRKGLVTTDQGIFRIWLGDADSDGRYDDVEDLIVIIDSDGDGKIPADLASPELFYPTDVLLPLGTIQIGDALYDIDTVSPDGRGISLVASEADTEPLVSLEVGNPAPVFELVILDGELVSAEDLFGRPVVLFFAFLDFHTQGTYRCGAIAGSVVSKTTMEAEQRLQDLGALRCEDDLQVYVVAIDDVQPSEERLAELDIPFPVIWDQQLGILFRGIPLVVIDADWTILAREEAYYKYDADGRVTGIDWAPLYAYDVMQLLWGE